MLTCHYDELMYCIQGKLVVTTGLRLNKLHSLTPACQRVPICTNLIRKYFIFLLSFNLFNMKLASKLQKI